MPKIELGALLVSRGLIPETHLEKAIERQRSFGGRIGTCLLEVGAVDEDVLLSVLSEQLGFPAAHRSELRGLSSDLTELLTADTALNCSAVPFRNSAGRIDVALLDPGDLALEDELAFSLGKPLRAHVATELRIVDALQRYYGGSVPLRFRSLLDRLELKAGRTASTPEPKFSPVPAYLRPDATKSRSSGKKTYTPPVFEKQAIPLTPKERAALQATATRVPTQPQPPDPRVEPVRFDLGQQLSEAETASQIGGAILQSLVSMFFNVLLFRVSSGREEVNGWMSFGPDVDMEWLRHYSVGLHHATVFRQLSDGTDLFRGRLAPTPVHQALARCWGGALERELVILPINVRGKLICAVSCDRGEEGIANVDVEFLQSLTKKASLAFERCILRRKLQTS